MAPTFVLSNTKDPLVICRLAGAPESAAVSMVVLVYFNAAVKTLDQPPLASTNYRCCQKPSCPHASEKYPRNFWRSKTHRR